MALADEVIREVRPYISRREGSRPKSVVLKDIIRNYGVAVQLFNRFLDSGIPAILDPFNVVDSRDNYVINLEDFLKYAQAG